ncbi:MAG: hypothetical protein KC441_20320 [Anaerolineales bacterium]|nr:hypothetical protein [Anaerolineales bacterium]
MKEWLRQPVHRALLALALIGGLGLGVLYLDLHSADSKTIEVPPDYGLVWFGENGRSQKALPGQPTPYFDTTRPTIIFVHGWLPDQVATPPTFTVDFADAAQDNPLQLDVAAAWLEAGWNVGIFYWHPFADEDLVWVAEDKIWSADQDAGMRYRDEAGNFHTEAMPTVSAGELFYQAYVAAMAGYNGPEIRLAGHSLGNQMVVRLADQLVTGIETGEVAENLLPTRVALLDPFWSPFAKSYLDGQETGTVVRQIIADRLLPRGVLVEWYRSSLLTEETVQTEAARSFQAEVLYTELDPEFCSLLDQVCRHNAAWQWYFLSFDSPAPPECVPAESSDTCIPTGSQGPSASTSAERLAEMMTAPFYWAQGVGPDGADGRSTPQADDDWFHRLPLPVLPEPEDPAD